MNRVIKKAKQFVRELHEDETGPGTVEWMLLVTVALVVLVAIYYVAQWAITQTGDAAKQVEDGDPLGG